MLYDDLLDALIPSTMSVNYYRVYKDALTLLNKIKCSRYKAMYFGSLLAGSDFFKEFKNDKEFSMAYFSLCIYAMDTLYNKFKNDTHALCETTLFLLYSALAFYFQSKDLVRDLNLEKLLEENDKYVKEDDLKEEFNG